MSEFRITDAVVVSWDFSHDRDKHILLVGRKTSGVDIKVINAFQGEEAHAIYEKLTTKKKGE